MIIPESISAAILGLVEGLTEFIPVSSTGHLLLIGHFLGFESSGKTFEVLIQLGAILAIVSLYIGRLLKIARDLPRDRQARHFVGGIVLAFMPAMLVGATFHTFIKEVLFNPYVVCVSLIVGGIVLWFVNRAQFSRDQGHDIDDISAFPISTYIKIGLFQCLAMIPGVSRSGATIVGALLLGATRKAAAEFSFFLAMPTMAGAFAYDLLKNYDILTFADMKQIAIGFICAFVTALLTVRVVLRFVTTRGYAPFAYWRIIVGTIGLVALLATGS